MRSSLLALLLSVLAVHAEETPNQAFNLGVESFYAGRMEESVAAFDRLIAAVPRAKPDLWQRGLSLYYAGRFAEGREQFESHRSVNPNDVENPVWHFLCVARAENVDAARRALLPVGPDPRVPMREVLALFNGTGDEAAVLRAADAGPEPAQRNQRCYAHLYLGLYAEARGDTDQARHHLRKAALDYRMDHYMGQVAQVHCQLRGW